jgi:tRNA A-37 threonylcarbamoyl transferase component Bud32
VSADEVSMSHAAFRIQIGGRPRFFVKAADSVGSRGRNLRVETEVYRLATAAPGLASVIPKCHYVDDINGVVVLDFVPGDPMSSSLIPAADRPDAREQEMLAAYGDVLARVHVVRPRHQIGEPPWLLVALEPGWGNYDWLPRPCGASLARLARLPELQMAFSWARSSWRATGLVHGDLRWSNAIVGHSLAHQRVCLVDWELAFVGDPAWDLGSIVADIVALLALWRAESASIDDVVAWSVPVLAAYRSAAVLHNTDWRSLVQRSLQMAIPRLVQTLVEIGYVDPAELTRVEPIVVAWIRQLLAEGPGVADALVSQSPQGSW